MVPPFPEWRSPESLRRRMGWAAFVCCVVSLAIWQCEDASLTAVVRAFGKEHHYLGGVWDLLNSLVGGTALAALLVACATLVRSRRTLHLLVVGQLYGGALCGVLKVLVDRPRPLLEPGSWPSGHAHSAFVFALVFAICTRRPQLWLWAVAVAVGAARVFVLRHWPADVVGGLGVALVAVALAMRTPLIVPAALMRSRAQTLLAAGLMMFTLMGLAFDPGHRSMHRAWTLLLALVGLFAVWNRGAGGARR